MRWPCGPPLAAISPRLARAAAASRAGPAGRIARLSRWALQLAKGGGCDARRALRALEGVHEHEVVHVSQRGAGNQEVAQGSEEVIRVVAGESGVRVESQRRGAGERRAVGPG